MDWNLLLGPAALTVGSVLAVVVLWRDHQRSDAVKDATILKLTEAVSAFPAALKDLTAVVVDSAERERTRPRTERAADRG